MDQALARFSRQNLLPMTSEWMTLKSVVHKNKLHECIWHLVPFYRDKPSQLIMSHPKDKCSFVSCRNFNERNRSQTEHLWRCHCKNSGVLQKHWSATRRSQHRKLLLTSHRPGIWLQSGWCHQPQPGQLSYQYCLHWCTRSIAPLKTISKSPAITVHFLWTQKLKL